MLSKKPCEENGPLFKSGQAQAFSRHRVSKRLQVSFENDQEALTQLVSLKTLGEAHFVHYFYQLLALQHTHRHCLQIHRYNHMHYYATATERVHKLYMPYIEVRVLLPQLQSPYSSLKVSLSAQSQPQTHRVPNASSESTSAQCVPCPNLQLRLLFAHALSHKTGV